MRKFVLIPLLLCLLGACSDDSPENNTIVQIRIKNTSTFDYTDVFVSTGGGEFNYGSINAQGASTYNTYDFAYRYAYVTLKIDGVQYVYQPIDYVGESLLKNGNYTYEISVENAAGGARRLSLNLAKD